MKPFLRVVLLVAGSCAGLLVASGAPLVNAATAHPLAAIRPAAAIPQHSMTPARAIAFVRTHHAAAAMLAALQALSPADRQYIITYALTPRKLVVNEP